MQRILVTRVLHRFVTPVLFLACFAIEPALANDESQAEDAESREFEVVYEQWAVTARNNELDYAFIESGGGLSGGGELQSLSHDRTGTPRISVRWWPTDARDVALITTFWDHDDTVTETTGERSRSVGALLASPDFAIGRSLVDSASAESRTRASAIDIGAAWRHSFGDHANLVIEGTIRVFRYERESLVSYERDLGSFDQEFVRSRVDSTGIGPRVAARFHRDLGTRFRLGARVGLAVPLGDRESSTSDTALIDGSFDRASVVESSTTRAFTQLDGALNFDARLGKGWSVGVTYLFELWTGIEDRRRFVDEVSSNTVVLEEGDVAFTGLSLGVTYTFGK